MSTIIICPSHPEYPTPLIQTFIFPQKEHWCPYCNAKFEMFGNGLTPVPETIELQQRLERFKRYSKPYRDAWASITAAQFYYDGKLYEPSKLPQAAKDKFTAIREEWKFNQRVEDVDGGDRTAPPREPGED